MMNVAKTPLKVILIGSFLGLLLLGMLFILVNQPQCPDNYTQAQVDASHCIVGANIGLGFLTLVSPLILLVTVVLVGVVAAGKKEKSPKKGKLHGRRQT